jgi:hypothetical protein
VRVEVAFRFPAVAAPWRRIHQNDHAPHFSRCFCNCNVPNWP